MAKMHADEFEIDIALVQRLITQQFPQWAEFSLKPVPSAGTDNALFRLGNEMVKKSKTTLYQWGVAAGYFKKNL